MHFRIRRHEDEGPWTAAGESALIPPAVLVHDLDVCVYSEDGGLVCVVSSSGAVERTASRSPSPSTSQAIIRLVHPRRGEGVCVARRVRDPQGSCSLNPSSSTLTSSLHDLQASFAGSWTTGCAIASAASWSPARVRACLSSSRPRRRPCVRHRDERAPHAPRRSAGPSDTSDGVTTALATRTPRAGFVRLEPLRRQHPCDLPSRRAGRRARRPSPLPCVLASDIPRRSKAQISIIVDCNLPSFRRTACPIQWLGLRSADVDALGLASSLFQPLTTGDIRRAHLLLRSDWCQVRLRRSRSLRSLHPSSPFTPRFIGPPESPQTQPRVAAEVAEMLRRRVKLELESLHSKGLDFLSTAFLPAKVLAADYFG